jgi:hypothetical protein
MDIPLPFRVYVLRPLREGDLYIGFPTDLCVV